jgi:acetyltransferase-like isoleucine patch superfamily enzyme
MNNDTNERSSPIVGEKCCRNFTIDAQEWSIYVGSPARRIKSRSQELLKLEAEYLKEHG